MRYLLFSAILFTFWSCQNDDSKATEMATDVCTCFQPLVNINSEVQALIKANKGREAELLLPKITLMQEEGQKCAASLVDKYGSDTVLDPEQVKSSMKKICPKILDAVGDGLFMR
jgi:hypothetical protein